MNCSVDGCDRISKSRGMCQMHYTRWWKYGDPLVIKRPKAYNGQQCAVDDCSEPCDGHGWCSKHRQRWRANGDPVKIQRRERGTGSISADGYKIVSIPGHPLANARGVFEHRAVLFDAIGGGMHPCHWCGTSVTWDITTPADPRALLVDHLDFDRLNNDLVNLVVSCWACNIRRTKRGVSGVRVATDPE